MTQTLAQTIYSHLDTLTGGITQFLAQGRDETWLSDVYLPFRIAALTPQRILFGFYDQSTGERVPDPAFSVTVHDGVVDLDSLVTDTGLGHSRGKDGATYCASFLAAILTRKDNGTMTRQT